MTLQTWDQYKAFLGNRRFDSHRRRAPTCRSAADFWARTVPEKSGCLAWAGPYHPDGYGSVCLNSRTVTAHRAAWMFANGAIPDGMWVLHRCDNRRCVNPDHLYLGTRADNAIDLSARWAAGEVSKTTRINPWEPSTRLNGGI